MKTIILERENIYCGALLLVNARYPLRDNGINGFIPVDARFPNVFMERGAAAALRLALEKISAKDAIVPVSGYRSSEEQAILYDSSLKEHGEDFTKKYVALPSHSEHQTGLAIDLGLNKKEIDFIRPDFPYDGICGRFRRVAPDYGFIERYAEGKEGLTGIAHEPWHFRYVGFPHSKIIGENGFSLEEYLEFIKDYREGSRLAYTQGFGAGAEIYYIPAMGGKTLACVPENGGYQISGNNMDGFVMTVWTGGE